MNFFKMSNWSTERSLQLIELFRQHRSLWDTKDPGYRNRNSKYDVWGEIALVMNDSRNEVERKMKNLLCHFHREYGKDGSSNGTKRYISRWFGYKPLLFLKERLLPRKMKKNVSGISSN